MYVLLDGTHLYTAVYMDDLVIFSKTWEDHLHANEILQQIEQANLTLRAEKNIGAAHCIFLGYEAGHGQMAPVQPKIEVI